MRRSGFCRRDLIAAISIAVVLLAIAMLWFARSSKSGRRTECQSQLKWIGAMLSCYSSDYDDRIMGLSWRIGQEKPFGAQLDAGNTDLQAVANQVVDFVNRSTNSREIEAIGRWLPNVCYSYLPL